MARKQSTRKKTIPKPSPLARKNRILTNLVLVLIAVGVVVVHYQSRRCARYEARFVALSMKSGQLYLETLRQKIEYLTILAEHGIVDPGELHATQRQYRQALEKERRKAALLRRKYGL